MAKKRTKKKPPQQTVVDDTPIALDGTITMNVVDGPVESLEVDFTVLAMLINDAEKVQPLRKVTDGDEELRYVTPRFLIELSRRVEEVYEYCTPSIAQQLWTQFHTIQGTLKNA